MACCVQPNLSQQWFLAAKQDNEQYIHENFEKFVSTFDEVGQLFLSEKRDEFHVPGFAAIHYAAYFDNVNVFKLLIKDELKLVTDNEPFFAKAFGVGEETQYEFAGGSTVIVLALLRNSRDVLHFLLNDKEQLFARLLNEENDAGLNGTLAAVVCQNCSFAKEYLNHQAVDAEFFSSNSQGHTVASFAALYHNEDVLRYLLKLLKAEEFPADIMRLVLEPQPNLLAQAMDADFRESKNVMMKTSAVAIQVFQTAIELTRKRDDPEFVTLRDDALAGRSLDYWVQELLVIVDELEDEDAVAGKEGEKTEETNPMCKTGDQIQDQVNLLSPVIPIVQSIKPQVEQSNTVVQPIAVIDVKAVHSEKAEVVKPGDDFKVAFAKAPEEFEKKAAKVAVVTDAPKAVPKKEVQKEEEDYDYYDYYDEEEAPKVPPKVVQPPKAAPAQIKTVQPKETAGKEGEYSDYYYSDE